MTKAIGEAGKVIFPGLDENQANLSYFVAWQERR
jgi:hypothetical protein